MRVALFDFDGTIADSGPTILASARAALAHLGYPEPEPARMRRFIGPPLLVGITEVLGVPAPDAVRFRGVYRAIYTERMTDADAYPGVPELLRALRDDGWTLGVATSKREDLASRILDALDLSDLFHVVAGGDVNDRRADKAWVLGRALGLLAAQHVDTSRAVMVGDRSHDIVGATEVGLRSIFVTWGYGPPEESAGAWAVADTPTAVRLALAEA